MTTAEPTVTLRMRKDDLSLEALSDQIGAALQQAGKDWLAQAWQAMENKLLEASDTQRRKRRGPHLLTPFGWMRLKCWQVWNARIGYSYPLDEAWGQERGQRASPGILQQATALATRLPYRHATHLVEIFLNEPVDHRTLYRWVQKAGAAIVPEEGAAI